MTRMRLRPKHSDEAEFYAQRYPDGYGHAVWPDHVERVSETVRFVSYTLSVFPDVLCPSGLVSVADLSCGDGHLAFQLSDLLGADRPVLGDVNSGRLSRFPHRMDACIPLPEALEYLDPVDLYVCSETLEHLDDPDAFLAALRPKTKLLVLTTPEGETGDGNPEHYWGWDSQDVGEMLTEAGFSTVAHQVFTPQYRTPDVIPTQMWICR